MIRRTLRSSARRPRCLYVGVALAILVAACGDDDSPAQPEAAASTTEASGEPIKIMAVADIEVPPNVITYPSAPLGVAAAVETINAAGGVAGRPIELIICDGKGDPNRAIDCGRRAVDEKVVALVGVMMANSQGLFDAVADAGIPFIGIFPADPASQTHALSYPMTGGTPGGFGGLAAVLSDVGGAKKPAVVSLNISAARAGVSFVSKALEARELELVTDIVEVEPGAADFSAAASTLVGSGADGIMFGIGANDGDRLLLALEQAGYDGVIARSTSGFSQEQIDQLGDLAEGVLAFTPFPPNNSDDSELEAYLAAMAKHEPDALLNDQTKNAWAATYVFKEAAEAAAEITPAGLVEVLDSRTFDPPLLPKVQFQTPVAGIGLPRIFNSYFTYLRVENGEFVLAEKTLAFHDPFVAP
jgi:branched-chain amino acid transport system substrate-binding protein